MTEYEKVGTSELRKLIRERGIMSGLALSSANKETCVKLLTGEITADQVRGASFASEGASTCQHQTGNAGTDDKMSNLAAALAAFVPQQKVDMDEVRRLACDAGRDAAINAVESVVKREIESRILPTKVVIEKRETGELKDMGVQHKAFPVLLKMCQARLSDGYAPNIYLYGPAGTGKTTAAKKIAEALGLKYYFNGAIDVEYKLSGFIDASGTFRSRPFYEAYSSGGVYLFDELDSSMPGAVMAFNSALANGYADFPVGRVNRHPDCVILAAGNTDMRGGRDGFNARNKMDAAFRDRFVFLEWTVDEALENAIDASYGDEWGWLGMVRRWRRNAERAGIRDFEVTPRAVGNGLAMLRAGLDLDTVTAACVRKALPADKWAKVEG